MALFSLLVVMVLERARLLPPWWRLTQWWSDTERSPRDRSVLHDPRWGFVLPLLPALAVGLLLILVDHLLWGLVSLLIWLAVLAAAIGEPAVRALYHRLIKAGCRQDDAALALIDESLRQQASIGNRPVTSLSEALLWLNFRHYAIIAWLAAIGGPTAVVLYISIRHLVSQPGELSPAAEQLYGQILHWVEAFFVRLSALLYVFVGDFSRSFPVWLESLYQWRESPSLALGRVACAAADTEALRHSPFIEACHATTLAKRHMVGVLVIIAVLTIYGWVI